MFIPLWWIIMMALILYLFLYLCLLPCDFKGLPTKRQSLFPCSLILNLVVWLALAKGILANDAESRKSTWVFLIVFFCFLHGFEDMPWLAPWGMSNTWSRPVWPDDTSQSQTRSAYTSWSPDIWASPAKYRITASYADWSAAHCFTKYMLIALLNICLSLYDTGFGVRCQVAILSK